MVIHVTRREGTMKKPSKGKRFHPEKYGMILCPDCGGSGKSTHDAKGADICKVCGGFGLIKKKLVSVSRPYHPIVLVNS